jgi:DNA-binding transcriptional LysR family regulator
MERAGFTPMVAAEINYNIHLQLALIQSGCGVGLLPARFIGRDHCRDTVEVLRPPSFDLRLSVAMVRVGQLGALEKAVELLDHAIRHLFESADTTKPIARSRRPSAKRRQARRRK